MASAYTPGLRVSSGTTIRKLRRLPLRGEVLVAVGQRVSAQQPIARALLPGKIRTLKVSEVLGVEAAEVPGLLRKREGDQVQAGELLAEVRSFFGLFRTECTSPAAGTIDHVSGLSGFVSIREPPTPLDLAAYVEGTVVEVLPEEGAVIETTAAFVQGIFGVGGERRGEILVVGKADQALRAQDIPDAAAGKVLVGGASAGSEVLRRAAQVGAAALVTGGIRDAQLREFVGAEIGVAITGQEQVPFTLVLTEGFGEMAMAERTFHLLADLQGRPASVNGATQIRAGVIRPELIVALDGEAPVQGEAAAGQLGPGCAVRVIREPYFGRLGEVCSLPAELMEIETGAMVRVAGVRLAGEAEARLIPRANLEIIW